MKDTSNAKEPSLKPDTRKVNSLIGELPKYLVIIFIVLAFSMGLLFVKYYSTSKVKPIVREPQQMVRESSPREFAKI